MGAVLGHANLIYHAAGWQEGGLTASFEKLVLDVEMLQMMSAFLHRRCPVKEPDLAFAAIAGSSAWRTLLRGRAYAGAIRARLRRAAAVQLAEL
jgi:trimethylamine:corrinoid methyltransferase-like protein